MFVEGFCQCSFLGISLCLLLFLCFFLSFTPGIPVCDTAIIIIIVCSSSSGMTFKSHVGALIEIRKGLQQNGSGF